MESPVQINRQRLSDLPPAKRKEAEQALASLEKALQANPLLRYNNPQFGPVHKKQVIFHTMVAGGLSEIGYLGGNQCLAGDTEVRMADGTTRAIRNIKTGDFVFGVNRAGQTRPVRVTATFENGVKPAYRWSFEKRGRGASLTATEDHKVLCLYEGRKLKVDRLGTMTFPANRPSRWMAQRAYGYDLPEVDGERWAMVLGLMLGDGCTTKKQRYAQFTQVDEPIIELMRNELSALGYDLCQNKSAPIQFLIRGGEVKFLEVAERFQMRCYAHEKHIPDECWNWSNAGLSRLLAGLWLTDGSIYKSKGNQCVASLTTASPDLAHGVQRILGERFGIYAPILKSDRGSKRRPTYDLKITSRADLQRFAESVELVGKKGERLRANLENWESNRTADAARLPLRGKEYVGEIPTYDIQVDHPDHLFLLANGLVVSNSGKTSAGIVDCLIQAVDWSAVPDHLKKYKKHTPPFRCRIAAQGREEIEDFIFEKIREWCPPDQLVGGSFKTAYDKQHHVLHFKNGSYFSFKTYAQEAQQWGGSTLDRVLMDEEPGPQHLQEARIRVMRREGQLLFTMTPVEGLSHMFDAFEDLIDTAEQGDGHAEDRDRGLVYVDMDDNPWLTEKAKEQALRGLSAEELKARKEGKFVALSGLIYNDFDPQVHVIPAITQLPENVNVVVGIDPGIRYACAVGWFYLDANDTMVMFDEGYFKDMTIKEVCDRIHRTNGYWDCEPIYYVIDPAAKNRNSQTGRSDQMEFADHGIVTIPGQNSVTAGINRCRERLQNQRFFVTESCRNFQKEIRTYRWKKPPRNAESDGREVPVKKDDHLLDEWRLVCMSRPGRPEVEEHNDETPGQRILREHVEQVARPQGVSPA